MCATRWKEKNSVFFIYTGSGIPVTSSLLSISRIVSIFAFVDGPFGTAFHPDACDIDCSKVPISRAIRIESSLSNPMRGR
jgi:hypothetical protein